MPSLTPTTAGLFELLDQGTDGVETFASTEGVASPWGPMQHGGPVAGLLTRAMDRLDSAPGTRLARVNVDLLGAVPIVDVRTRAEVVRAGRRIELVESVLEARDGAHSWRRVARAQAWRLATQPTDDVVNQPTADRTVPDEDVPAGHLSLPEKWTIGGFVAAMEWRGGVVSQVAGEPSTAWLRLRHPLVAGEETSGLVGAMTLSDVANGVGARLDPEAFTFLNTDLTVQFTAPPTGPWFAISAETVVGPDGVGLSQGVMHDSTGSPVARVAQTLLVERRD